MISILHTNLILMVLFLTYVILCVYYTIRNKTNIQRVRMYYSFIEDSFYLVSLCLGILIIVTTMFLLASYY